MNRLDQDRLYAIYCDGLFEDVLPFWIRNCIDREHGGFMMSLDQDGSVIDTDKSVWQQGRFTWLLGELYNNIAPNPEWLELARHGVEFIDECCFDPTDGRMWFHLNRAGQPIRKRRYAFSESFAAIAYGEFAQASGDEVYAKKAEAAFHRFVSHLRNPPSGNDKFTHTRPTRGIGPPMILLATAQELRASIDLPKADTFIDQCIEEIREFHIKPEIQCVMETVGPYGEFIDHFDGRTLNPGHAIEAAWFVLWEAKYRNDPELVALGCQMLDWMWERGWDQEYGGILYFVDVHGGPVQEYWHDMKFWWPQNEAIIATLLAHLLTDDPKYALWHQQAHDWAYQHFPDPDHGEWFGYLHRDGRISTRLKGNLWKGPFHLPRMQLICSELLAR